MSGRRGSLASATVSTAEIVRLVEALPELSPHIRKVNMALILAGESTIEV